MSDNIPPAPKVRIFLRDDFQLRAGKGADFLAGVEGQLSYAYAGGIKMVAACAERRFNLADEKAGPPPPMMHIWQMPDWHSLYSAMHGSSENSWYEQLGGSIAHERQELLVNLRIGFGTDPPILSKQPTVYLYEEIRLKGARVSLGFQRALGTFSRLAAEQGWTWLWCATQVTGEPQLLCQLWSANSEAAFETGLLELQKQKCFEELISRTESLTRRYMYPISVENLAYAEAESIT